MTSFSGTRRTVFTEADITAFAPAEKIALVATINPRGLPHITLITSLMASGPKQMTLGEFSKGRSKAHLRANPDMAFLIMTRDRKLWRGRAAWTHVRREGPEYEIYNNQPMFRYNAYFGINTVHYLDLVEIRGPEALPLARIVASTVLTQGLRKRLAENRTERILKPFAEQNIFNNLSALKFISWIEPDGSPALFPVIQCRASDSGRLALVDFPYRKTLTTIPEGATVAVFGLTMVMESVLVRGRLTRKKISPGLSTMVVDIDWVYNSMPPCHGQIHPMPELSPVTDFTDPAVRIDL